MNWWRKKINQVRKIISLEAAGYDDEIDYQISMFGMLRSPIEFW